MVKEIPAFLVSDEWLSEILGLDLTKKELAHLRQHIEIRECEPFKQVFSSENADPGIYIVHNGKVRLI